MNTASLMRIGGAPAPDPARVDVIRGAMDLNDPTLPGAFGERARQDLLNLTAANEALGGSFLSRINMELREIGRASCRERVVNPCRSRWSPYH